MKIISVIVGLLVCLISSGCVCSWGPGVRPIRRGLFVPPVRPLVIAQGPFELAPIPYYRYHPRYHFLPYRPFLR
jgi:hypothetical protein